MPGLVTYVQMLVCRQQAAELLRGEARMQLRGPGGRSLPERRGRPHCRFRGPPPALMVEPEESSPRPGQGPRLHFLPGGAS